MKKEEERRKKEECSWREICARCSLRFLLSAFILLPSLALAQPEFRVSSSTEATPEGGNVNILNIQTDKELFQLRVPKNYGAQAHPGDLSIVFSSETGSSVITLQMSTNYAGGLPKAEDLCGLVAKKHPTASLVQTSRCYTDCGTGLMFDLFQPAAGNMTMRLRDAYVSFAEGSFEFTLSCDQRDYDHQRLSFSWLLNSFRLRPEPAKKNR